ncbi:MAG TPA: GcrA family cell cycle regulator [Stellaceae bacterium]|nr:GcrA family cell cycle regulator [Stellaceae bacterium]
MSGEQWTPERDARLRELVERDGLNFGEAAKVLGITKNAALGRAGRIKLVSPRAIGALDNTATIFERLDTVSIFPPVGRCVFPNGHPGTEGFAFCGERVDAGRVYCAEHHRRTHQGTWTAAAE